MFVKKSFATALFTIGLSLPLFAHAELVIKNNTKEFSTSRINDGYCSSEILGDDGVTKPGDTKKVDNGRLFFACRDNLEDCKADVYMTNNCTGDLITTVIFSFWTGIKSATPPKNGYSISFNGFYVELSGGPNNPKN